MTTAIERRGGMMRHAAVEDELSSVCATMPRDGIKAGAK